MKDFSPDCAQVKPEDLKVFGNVAYIDASINSLSLGDCLYMSCRFTFSVPLAKKGHSIQ